MELMQASYHKTSLYRVVLIAVFVFACTDEKRNTENSETVPAPKPPNKMNSASPNKDQESILNDSSLTLLPPLISAGGVVNSDLLSAIGIAPGDSSQVIQAIQQARESARRSRDEATRSLRFELDTPVSIPPLSEEEIATILDQFTREISSLEAEGGVNEVGILLRRQLKKEFQRPTEVTLKRQEGLSLSHYSHTPAEYFGLGFEVKRQKDNGATETFTVDPVQDDQSEFFFLNLKR